MAKIIRLFNEQEQAQARLIEHIKEFLQMAERGEIKTMLIAAHHADGSVVTGYCNLDVMDKQFLNSHVQVDIMFEVTQANADELFY